MDAKGQGSGSSGACRVRKRVRGRATTEAWSEGWRVWVEESGSPGDQG